MISEVGDRERDGIVHDLASPDEEVRRLAVERLLALPADESIPRLIESLGDDSWRVRKAAVERLVSCSESQRVVDALIGALADGDNPGRRNSAVEALTVIGTAVIPKLLEALDSHDVDVRKQVVDTLSGIGDESTREALIGALQDADSNVCAAAADALGVIGGPGVAEALSGIATRKGADHLVRLSALRSLVRLEIPVEVSELSSALEDAVLRPAAFALLGYVDGEEALAHILAGVASESRSSREAAMEALLRIYSRRQGDDAAELVRRLRKLSEDSDHLIASIAERLADADLSSRLVLVQFLALIGTPECVMPVLKAGRDEAIAEVAQASLESLGAVAERAIDEHWPELDVELRRDACEVLGRTCGARGSARLLAALDDSDSELRSAAARALGMRRCADALPALIRRLEASATGDEFEVEEEVATLVDALVALARPEGAGADSELATEAISLLEARLEGAIEAVRLSIARVLGRVGRREDAELVARLLKDPSAQVRRSAVEALSRLEPGAAFEPLRLALADESPLVRMAAAVALGQSDNPKVLDDLQRLMLDEDVQVAAAAVRAIGTHCAGAGESGSGGEVVAFLEHALTGSGMLAMAAVEALLDIGGVEAARAASGLLGSPEPELVQAAAGCIGAYGDAETLGELLPLIQHSRWVVRAEVIQVLADRGVARAVPAILRRLESEQDSFVRESILCALKRLED
jgi:HEAT repeat protein